MFSVSSSWQKRQRNSQIRQVLFNPSDSSIREIILPSNPSCNKQIRDTTARFKRSYVGSKQGIAQRTTGTSKKKAIAVLQVPGIESQLWEIGKLMEEQPATSSPSQNHCWCDCNALVTVSIFSTGCEWTSLFLLQHSAVKVHRSSRCKEKT
jgi:hypothetical protein